MHTFITIRDRVLPNLTQLTLFDKSWSAEEELLLLDGISMYGMGNFRDVATHVHSKTEAQCLAHYTTEFLKTGISDATPVAGAAIAASAAAGGVARAIPSATTQAAAAQVPKTEIGGYFPLRGDFDIEYDNDAEKILADSALDIERL